MPAHEPKPTEAEVAALLASAGAVRNKPSRALWWLALLVSLVCVIALAYGLVTYWDTPPEQTAIQRDRHEPSAGGSGFGLGLMIGLGVGIAIGSVLALRKRQS